ncbi:hypothetical protein PR048_023863 [Dryococelus australis]|uniref:DUF4371 domain-containing protein n=1 Tax=Dryococelus australis TaxID=614101 RepID=A0ABQ9GV96_9NEOP|nr:hypothetical protein PR048_023863 [Dryococelus australis]
MTDLTKLNGVNVRVGLHSQYNAVEMIEHISKEMKELIIRQIKGVSGKISIIIDESTSLSSKSVKYLKKHLVGFTRDGSSVMLGKHSAVAQKCLFQYPNVIIWHCLNYRLELALANSVDVVGGVNHFHIFID